MSETIRSIWRETAPLPSFEPLRSDMKTDVLIIGGGLSGILCAYMLKNAGVDYALVEAKNICGSVTQNTTAKITFQHGLIYSKLMDSFGSEKAQMYLHANQLALNTYRELCTKTDCDFEEKDNYVYSLRDHAALDAELSALQKIGVPAQMKEHLPLPIEPVGAVCVPAQAQFNPLKFVSSIAKELRIYENTPILELAPSFARTPHGNIRARKIIVATHFPMLNKHGSYFMKLYQHRSYVLTLENAHNVQGMYVTKQTPGCPSAITAIYCCLAAVITARANRAAAGASCTTLPALTIRRRRSVVSGQRRTACRWTAFRTSGIIQSARLICMSSLASTNGA